MRFLISIGHDEKRAENLTPRTKNHRRRRPHQRGRRQAAGAGRRSRSPRRSLFLDRAEEYRKAAAETGR